VDHYFMPANIGSGVALFDYNNDGRLDIYLVQNAGKVSSSRNALFRQEPDGRFTDVSKQSGLDATGWGMGVAVGDVDNDGWSDVVLTEFNAVRLFHNEGSGAFREVSDSGLDNPFWAVSASFVDYDRDGWLDLVVANYLPYDPTRVCLDESGKQDFCGPSTFPRGTVTKLFHNRGAEPGARFEDVTIRSGMGDARGSALGVVCADFDGDGWQDILVANDGEPNRLWINQRSGTFKDEALGRGIAVNGLGRTQGNMGVAIADLNGDGLLDVFVTHLIEENNGLWVQSPRGLFQDRTPGSGLARTLWHGTGFGAVAQDLNNDGAPDLAVANGAVRRNKMNQPEANTIAENGTFWAAYAERNQLLANDGQGNFRDISGENLPFCGTARVGRGLVYGDLDNDGGLDLVVSNIGGKARIYRNAVPNRGTWLTVRLVDPALGGRDIYGAVVTVIAAGRTQTRWCNPGTSYASSNDPRAHFGLGTAQQFEAIDVTWPDGIVERFPGGAAERFVVLRKGEGGKRAP
jgi:hypothetical protein